MAKRVSHERELAPFVGCCGFLHPCARCNCLFYGGPNVLDHKIKVNWRPVTLIGAALRARLRCGRSLIFCQQVYGGRGTEHLNSEVPEAATDSQSER